MLREILFEKSGIDYANVLIVQDIDSLWRKCDLTDDIIARGYHIYSAIDSIELRYIYEKHIILDHEKCVLLYDDCFVPYDIRKSATVFEVTYGNIFPMLHADILRSFPNLNLDLLSIASREIFNHLSKNETEELCSRGIWQPYYVSQLAEKYQDICNEILKAIVTKDTWPRISEMMGFVELAERLGAEIPDKKGWYDTVTSQFANWMGQDYQYLSGTPTKKQPYLLSQVLDYIRRNNRGKVVLVVLDGMNFSDFHMIRRDMARNESSLHITGVYSFVPSITSIARQSLFSGKLPIEHPKPFDLSNEEKQFRKYWIDNGYEDKEIFFAKSEEPEWSSHTKVAGIVINIVDDIMHSELQGEKGMCAGLGTWLEGNKFSLLMKRLLADGFTVYITADHGNTPAIAQGRFQKPNVITESASRRAVIYQSFAGAEELDDFAVQEYTGHYLPKEYRYYTFDAHWCYGDKGTKYISHGGMTIEEVVVPFVKIGE